MTTLTALSHFLSQLTIGLTEAAIFVSFFWVIHLFNILSQYKLSRLGIIPREPLSLITGPWCATILHADFNHLFYNSPPLLCMTALLFAQSITQGISIIISISIFKSLLVWIIARRGIHIGASGLIVGLFFYLLFQGYHNPGISQVITAFILLYYFGSLLFSIFPSDLLTSFEGHLSGMISGITIAYLGTPTFLLPLSTYIAKNITGISILLGVR